MSYRRARFLEALPMRPNDGQEGLFFVSNWAGPKPPRLHAHDERQLMDHG